ACTVVTDSNARTAGRIDFANDVDCFFFQPTSTASDLVARVTKLSAGMSPVVTVYDANGTTQLLQIDLEASENDTVGTVATIPAANLSAAGHVIAVSHKDVLADQGNYEFSIGVKQ